jgi:hypothetical protein
MAQEFHEESESRLSSEPPVAGVVQELSDRDGRHSLVKGVAAGGLAMGGALGIWQVAHGHDMSVAESVPFSPVVQTVAEHVDSGLEDAGLAFPVVAAGIGLVRVRARRNPQLQQLDILSSGTPITDGSARTKNRAGRAVTISAAVTTAAASLGGFIGSIGTEVSTGDLRPINAMYSMDPHGAQSIIGENSDIEPMVQSSLNRKLEENLEQGAAADGVETTPFNLNLGSYIYDNHTGNTLTVAMQAFDATNPELTPKFGCSDIPVLIDTSAHVPIGQHITLDGVTAEVVGDIPGTASSTNRIGIVTSTEVLKSCIEQDPDAPDYGLILNASPEAARRLLAAADRDGNIPAAALSTEQFLENSENFWDNNVEALVGVLALAALLVSGVSMAGATRQRLLQDRGYWAQNLSQGVPDSFIRKVELFRAAKTGVNATVAGVLPAFALSMGADAAIQGFNASMGVREAALGTAVALLGSASGAALSTLNPEKTISIREETRG